MVTLEQVKQLEEKVVKAIEYVTRVTGENKLLQGKLDGSLQRISELEGMVQRFKDDQNRIEEGIISALDRLNQFEDAIGKSLSSVHAVVSSGLSQDLPQGALSEPLAKVPEIPVKPETFLAKPPEASAKLSETLVKPPETSAKLPETLVKPPETPAKLSENLVKPPETSAKPPEMFLAETPAKLPETLVKPPETPSRPAVAASAVPIPDIFTIEDEDDFRDVSEESGSGELDIF